MFIIFGTRGLKHTVSESPLILNACPNCKSGNLENKLYRRWFTLFFIPVIPLDVIDRFYECTNCSSAYNEKIKDLLTQSQADQQKQQQEAKRLFAHALISAMTHMAMIDGSCAPQEEREILDMAANFTEMEPELRRVMEKIKLEGNKDNQVFELLNSARQQLSAEALLNILAQAGVVLLADGTIEKQEEELMKDYLLACGLPKDMYVTIIEKLKVRQLAKQSQANVN
jgi:tellurite resistance protein